MHEAAILDAVSATFRDVFGNDTLTITPATTAADIPEWDSLRMVLVLASLEARFAVRFTTREMDALKTVNDIVRAIARHTASSHIAWPDAGTLDAPFRACVAEGARILAGLSILVCTPSPYDPARFRHLWMTVRFLSGLACRRVKIIVLTDTTAPDDVRTLQRLLAPISDETVIQPEANIADPRDLPWRHKRLIEEEFLSDPEAFDLFVYLEDDMFLTSENIAYFVAFRQALDAIGFIPSFIRCEYNLAQKQVFSIDHVARQPILAHQKLQVGRTTFVNSNYPFCAMYIFDHALARAHLGTRSASQALSGTIENWGVIELASLGQMFEDVKSGFFSRYLLPIDPATLWPMPACVVHHGSDKYTNLDVLHGRVPLEEIFARWP